MLNAIAMLVFKETLKTDKAAINAKNSTPQCVLLNINKYYSFILILFFSKFVKCIRYFENLIKNFHFTNSIRRKISQHFGFPSFNKLCPDLIQRGSAGSKPLNFQTWPLGLQARQHCIAVRHTGSNQTLKSHSLAFYVLNLRK
jgi:hypothetical protein